MDNRYFIPGYDNPGDNNTLNIARDITAGVKGTGSSILRTAGPTGYGKSSYDEDIQMRPGNADELEKLRGKEQSFATQAGNALMQAVFGQVIGGTLQDLGYVAKTFQTGSFIDGQGTKYHNALSDIGNQLQQGVQDAFPIYRTYDPNTFDPGKWSWWMNQLPSAASTASMFIPGIAAEKSISVVGKVLNLTNKFTKAERWAIKGLAGATISRIGENGMEAGQTYDDTYQNALQNGYTEADAKEAASRAAAFNWRANWANMIFDIPQYLFLNAPFGKISTENTIREAKAMGLNITPVVARTIGTSALEMGSEGIEEGNQYISDKEGKRKANQYLFGKYGDLSKLNTYDQQNLFGSTADRLKQYAGDGDFWTSMVAGSLGAGASQMVFKAVRNRQENQISNDKISYIKDLAPQMHEAYAEMQKATDAGDTDKYETIRNKANADMAIKAVRTGNFENAINTLSDLKEMSPEEYEATGAMSDEEKLNFQKNLDQSIKDFKQIGTLYGKYAKEVNEDVAAERARSEFLLSKLSNQRSDLINQAKTLESTLQFKKDNGEDITNLPEYSEHQDLTDRINKLSSGITNLNDHINTLKDPKVADQYAKASQLAREQTNQELDNKQQLVPDEIPVDQPQETPKNARNHFNDAAEVSQKNDKELSEEDKPKEEPQRMVNGKDNSEKEVLKDTTEIPETVQEPEIQPTEEQEGQLSEQQEEDYNPIQPEQEPETEQTSNYEQPINDEYQPEDTYNPDAPKYEGPVSRDLTPDEINDLFGGINKAVEEKEKPISIQNNEESSINDDITTEINSKVELVSNDIETELKKGIQLTGNTEEDYDRFKKAFEFTSDPTVDFSKVSGYIQIEWERDKTNQKQNEFLDRFWSSEKIWGNSSNGNEIRSILAKRGRLSENQKQLLLDNATKLPIKLYLSHNGENKGFFYFPNKERNTKDNLTLKQQVVKQLISSDTVSPYLTLKEGSLSRTDGQLNFNDIRSKDRKPARKLTSLSQLKLVNKDGILSHETENGNVELRLGVSNGSGYIIVDSETLGKSNGVGNVFLVLPKELSLNGQKLPIKLNKTKLSTNVSKLVFSLYIELNDALKGNVALNQAYISDKLAKRYNIQSDRNVLITDLLNLLVYEGDFTINNKPGFEEKQLYIDRGILHFGKDGNINLNNIQEGEINNFVNWAKTYKTYTTNKNMFYVKNPNTISIFANSENPITFRSDENYETSLLNNGLLTLNMNDNEPIFRHSYPIVNQLNTELGKVKEQKEAIKPLSVRTENTSVKEEIDTEKKDTRGKLIGKIPVFGARQINTKNLVSAARNFKKLEQNKELNEVKRFLGSNLGNVNFSDEHIKLCRVINGVPEYTHAQMSADLITVHDGAIEGALYHEAFHRISLLFLSPKQREKLYDNAREEFGDDGDIEEVLAEKFREYKLNNTIPKNSKIKEFFNRLLNYLKSFLKFNKLSERDITVDKIFNAINSGAFRYSKINKESYNAFKNDNSIRNLKLDKINLDSVRNEAEFDNIVDNLALQLLEKNKIYTIDDIANKKLDNNSHQVILDSLKQFINENLDPYFNEDGTPKTELSEEEASEYSRVKDLYREIIDNYEAIYLRRINDKLEDLGIKETSNTFDAEDEERVSGDYSYIDKQTYETSRKDNAQSDIKTLIQSLRAYDYDNSTKQFYPVVNPSTYMQEFADSQVSWKLLFDNLWSSTTYQSMRDKLNDLSLKYPQFLDLIDRLDNSNELLRTKFFNTFSANKYNFRNIVVTQDAGEYKVEILNADLGKQSDELLKDWNSEFSKSDLVKENYTEKENPYDIREINNLLSEYSNVSSDIKKLDRQNKLTAELTNSINNVVGIVNKLGIDIDKPTIEVMMSRYPNSANLGKALIEVLNQDLDLIFKNANGGFLYELKDKGFIKTNKGNEFNPAKILRQESKIRALADFHTMAHPDSGESSILGPDGNAIYAIGDNSYFTDISRYIKDDDEYLDKLMQGTYQKDSWMLNAIKNNPGLRRTFNISNFLNFIVAKSGDKGRGYLDISDLEDYIAKMSANLSDKLTVPVLADKKPFFFIEGLKRLPVVINTTKVGNNTVYNVNDEVVEQFVKYARTEWEAIKEANKEIDNFLKKNGLSSINEFNELVKNGRDIETFDYTNLVELYHYKTDFIKTNDGKKVRTINFAKGNAGKFRYFTFLQNMDDNTIEKLLGIVDNSYLPFAEMKNNLVKVTTSNGKTVNTSLITTINHALSSRINDEINYLKDNLEAIETRTYAGRNDVLQNKFLPKNLIEDIIKQNYPDKNAVNDILIKEKALIQLIGDNTITSMMNVIEFEKMVSGDPAFYKNQDDKVKRLSGLVSTGKNLRLDWPIEHELRGIRTYKSMQLATTTYESKLYKSLLEKHTSLYKQQFLNEGIEEKEAETLAKEKAETKLEGYKSIDQTDAQVYISAEMYKKIKMMLGEWSEYHDKAFDVLEKKTDISSYSPEEQLRMQIEASNLVMQPLKMVHYGIVQSDNLNVPTYDKMSLAGLFKVFTEGRDIDKLYEYMKQNNVDMAKYDSATKSGARQAHDFYTDSTQSEIKSFDNVKTVTQEFKNLRKQLVTDPHDTDHLMFGTQAAKISMSNIRPDFEYTLPTGEKLKGTELLQEYIDTVKALSDIGANEIRNSLVSSTDENGNILLNKKKLVDLLREEGRQNKVSPSLLKALRVDNNGEFAIELATFQDRNWFDSRFISMVNKKAIDINVAGNAFIQMSNFGFKSINSVKSDNFNTELKFKRPENNRLQVVISVNLFKHALPENVKNGTFEQQREYLKNNPELTALGYRIPTQGTNSITPLEVVDFLPSNCGDTIVLPGEFTKLTGSDFDIDKLYVARYSYKIDKTTGNLRKEEFRDGKDKWKNNSKGAIQNRLLDLFYAPLLSNEHALETETPLDAATGPLKDIAQKVAAYRDANNKLGAFQVLSPNFQQRLKKQNTGAKMGIAPFALANVHHILSQISGLNIKGLDDLGINSLHEISDNPNIIENPLDRQLITDWLSALINAHVDAAKDPYIVDVNVVEYTYSTCALMIRAGFGMPTFWFLPQPILTELSAAFDKTKGKIAVDDNAKNQFTQQIVKEYKKKLDNKLKSENIQANQLITRNNLDYFNTNFLESQLSKKQDERDAQWYSDQLAIYNIFSKLKQAGDELQNVVQGSQIDTKKFGSTFIELKAFKNRMAKAARSVMVDSFNRLLNQTFLGRKYDNSIGLLDKLFSDTLPMQTEGYSNLIDTYLNMMRMSTTQDVTLLKNVETHAWGMILSDFFNNTDNNLNKLNSLVERFSNLKSEILTNEKYSDLKDNMVFKMIRSNFNGVNHLTINKNRINSVLLKQRFTNAWNELLTDSRPEISNIAKDLVSYSFFTSVGKRNKNSFYELIDPSYLANIKNKDGITLNQYVKSTLQSMQSGSGYDTYSNRFHDFFRNMWFNDNIVPRIQSNESMSDMTIISPSISNSNSLFIGTTNEGDPLYKPYVKIVQEKQTYNEDPMMFDFVGKTKDPYNMVKADTSTTILYKYIGYKTVKSGDEYKSVPVYAKTEKLGNHTKDYSFYEFGKEHSNFDENKLISKNISNEEITKNQAFKSFKSVDINNILLSNNEEEITNNNILDNIDVSEEKINEIKQKLLNDVESSNYDDNIKQQLIKVINDTEIKNEKDISDLIDIICTFK